MRLHNATEFEAGYNLGLEKDGHHCLVVVAKATFDTSTTPNEPSNLPLKEEQVPVYHEDIFRAEPGESALLYENDFAPFKPKCDVLFNGSAYAAPYEETTNRVVQIRIGTMNKSFRVIGKSVWVDGMLSPKSSEPIAFKKEPISYEVAYGGYDLDPNKPAQNDENYVAYPHNPIGQGYAPFHDDRSILGKPLSQTQELSLAHAHTKSKKYIPQAFGAVARHWYPRYTLAGTYDAHWEEHDKPFLPKDFNEAFYQCAPQEQQIDYLEGGEELLLKGLTPEGERTFKLPKLEVAMEVIRSNGERTTLTPVVDTLIIEPDQERIVMTTRAKIALKRSIHEVDTIIVGTPDELWEKKRLYGECYEEETAVEEEQNG